jgi:hypothetical protein
MVQPRDARWLIFMQKIPIWAIFGGPWNGNVGIFNDHLEYFTAIRYNICPFGIVCGHLVHFSRFGTFGARNIWQPCCSRHAWLDTFLRLDWLTSLITEAGF